MKHIISFVFISIISLSFTIAYAREQEKLRVAIMDFSGEDVTPGDAKKVSDLVRTEMINTGQYMVIERNEMGKILREQGFSMTGCTDISCAVQAGKLLSARKMLVGTVMKLDESLIINGRIIDVEKGTAEFAQKEIARTRRDLVGAVDAFVIRLTKRIAPKGYARQYSEFEKKTSGKIPARTYGYAALPFLCLSIAGAGVAVYADKKYMDTTKRNEDSRDSWFMAMWLSRIAVLPIGTSTDSPEIKKYMDMRLYSSIASGVMGGVAIVLGIVWLTKLSEEGQIGTNGDININQKFALTLPPQYYNVCFNFTKKNQYGFGLGLSMRF